MNILIVGGGGLIGSGLTTYFLDNGHKVIVLDNFTSSLHNILDKRATIITGSATSYSILNNIFSSFRPDYVFHLADNVVDKEGIYSFTDESDTYVSITNNLLRCINKTSILHLFLGSSSEVYSSNNKNPISENSSVGINSYTGGLKYYSEEVVKFFSAAKKINYTFLRYFQIYGNRRFINPKFDLVSYLVDTVVKKQGVFIVGPKVYTDVLSSQDAVNATALVFEKIVSGEKIEAINIGSGSGIQILDLYNKITDYLQVKDLPVYKLKPRQQTRSLVADNTLLKSLGWEQKNTLDTDLPSLVEFIKGLPHGRR